MLALKQFFAGRKCTVLLLDDMSSEAAGLHVKTIVHGVLSLTQSAPAYGADRRQLRILKLRGAPYRGGYHDFCVETGGLRVYPRLVAGEHHRDYASGLISSGIPTLDDLLGGGLDRGSSTLVMGPARAGKTSLAMHYAVKACEESSRVAMYIFDENRGLLLRRRGSMGQRIVEHVATGLLHIQQIDPAELSPGALTFRSASKSSS
jgi:circadian clock protein KaiC